MKIKLIFINKVVNIILINKKKYINIYLYIFLKFVKKYYLLKWKIKKMTK